MRRSSAGLSAAPTISLPGCPGLPDPARADKLAGGFEGSAAGGGGPPPVPRMVADFLSHVAGREPDPVRVVLAPQRALTAFLTTGNRVLARDGTNWSARRDPSAPAAADAAPFSVASAGAVGKVRWRVLALAGLVLAVLGGSPGTAAQPATTTEEGLAGPVLSPAQRSEVVALLKESLRTDPSILRDAIAALAQADAADAARVRREALLAEASALFRNPADPVLGNPQGDVTLVEFFDARCGYCKSMAPAVTELLRRDAGVRLVLKDLPILGAGSVFASRALLAAQKQGKYAPMYGALMQLRGEPTEAVLQAEAARLGLDWQRLRRDMDDPTVLARLEENLRLARVLGIEGTPALVAGNVLLPGAADLASLERMVADARRGG